MRKKFSLGTGTFAIIVFAIAMALMVLSVVLPLGCGGKKGVSLEYDHSPNNAVIEYQTGGGLAANLKDRIPEYQLFGDGKVIRRSGESDRGIMLEGKLSEEEVQGLLEQVEETGFFELKDEYVDEAVVDGISQDITVNLKDEKKRVYVYMEEVEAFDETRDLIMNYPLEGATDYVPEKGYLIVHKLAEGEGQIIDPASPIYAMLPDVAALEQAANEGKPLAIEGKSLVEIKKFESQQEHKGLDVQVGGINFKIYPAYSRR